MRCRTPDSILWTATYEGRGKSSLAVVEIGSMVKVELSSEVVSCASAVSVSVRKIVVMYVNEANFMVGRIDLDEGEMGCGSQHNITIFSFLYEFHCGSGVAMVCGIHGSAALSFDTATSAKHFGAKRPIKGSLIFLGKWLELMR